MPELPEVEVIRRGLAERVPGRTIERVEVRKANVLELPEDELQRRLEGRRIEAVRRRGKFLILPVGADALIVHLGMTGQLTFWDRAAPDSPGFIVQDTTGLQRARQHAVDKHTHVTFWFSDGDALHYRDIRMFGLIQVWPVARLHEMKGLGELGPEPLEDAFTLEHLSAGLKGRKRAIKAQLLDQHFVAGVGNIYADEALFRAGIGPERLAGRLTRAERERLFEAIPAVLRQGIEFGGTSMRDYIDSDGQRGSNQEALRVYGREGEPCYTCGTPIRRVIVAQRSSHYCPRCQRRGRGRGRAGAAAGTKP